MAFELVRDRKEWKKMALICTGCGIFKTKTYIDTDRGHLKMNREADKHYKDCSATKK